MLMFSAGVYRKGTTPKGAASKESVRSTQPFIPDRLGVNRQSSFTLEFTTLSCPPILGVCRRIIPKVLHAFVANAFRDELRTREVLCGLLYEHAVGWIPNKDHNLAMCACNFRKCSDARCIEPVVAHPLHIVFAIWRWEPLDPIATSMYATKNSTHPTNHDQSSNRSHHRAQDYRRNRITMSVEL